MLCNTCVIVDSRGPKDTCEGMKFCAMIWAMKMPVPSRNARFTVNVHRERGETASTNPSRLFGSRFCRGRPSFGRAVVRHPRNIGGDGLTLAAGCPNV